MSFGPYKIFQTLLVLVLLISCKKIDLPDNDTRKLIGEWTYLNSIGGPFADGPIWPTDKSIWIEFKDNGHYKKHEKGKLVKTEKFSFTPSKNKSDEIVIEYKTKQPTFQAFLIRGDTLDLWDYYVADGCYFTFVRR